MKVKTNFWNYTPICLIMSPSIQVEGNVATVEPSRFLRPAFWRVVHKRQPRLNVMEVLSPKEYKRKWLSPLDASPFADLDSHSLEEIFKGLDLFALSHDRIKKILWKNRPHNCATLEETLLMFTDAYLDEDKTETVNESTQDLGTDIMSYVWSSVTGASVNSKVVLRCMAEQDQSGFDVNESVKLYSASKLEN